MIFAGISHHDAVPDNSESPLTEVFEHPEPKVSTVKELYGSALFCAMPGCRQPLYRSNETTARRVLNSRVAHIHARRSGGPRWEPEMTSEANRAFANLVLMCERHAHEIDATPEHYPADLLRAWKQEQLEVCRRAEKSWLLTDDEVDEVAAKSAALDELAARITAVVPFSGRLRSRAEALAYASSSTRARRLVRHTSVPADRVAAVLDWRRQGQPAPLPSVPTGAVRVLVAPMGAGKSEIAEDWWDEGLTEAWADPESDIPVWLEARDVTAGLESSIQQQLGHDPVKGCRIVVDNLDLVSVRRADQILEDARRYVLTWPAAAVLATTRPGAGSTAVGEPVPVEPWPYATGIELLGLLLGEQQSPWLGTREEQELLTSPLQVHALAARLLTGGQTKISRLDLLAGLARSIVARRHPDSATKETWDALARLACSVLDSETPVESYQFGREYEIWGLTATGLVVEEQERLRFALPLFEQHFGAQALREGIADLEDAAGIHRFPRWRYALAFAFSTATDDEQEEMLARLVGINPAAASWVIDEITAVRAPSTLGEALHAPGVRTGMPSQAAAISSGTLLRTALQGWLDGLGPLAAELYSGSGGRLVPWGVFRHDGIVAIGEASPEVSLPSLTPLLENPFHEQRKFPWTRLTEFALPQSPLERWRWARKQLQTPLRRALERRTLPVPPQSPLAAERLWYLAVRIMDKNRLHLQGLDLKELRETVDAMAARAEGTMRCQWQTPGYTLDTADVLWVQQQLADHSGDTLTNPRPVPDNQARRTGLIWDLYSPELTRDIAENVLRDAVTGYRHLVETNFPSFGPALGLYSVLPVQVRAEVIHPQPGDVDRFPGLRYALFPEANPASGTETSVEVRLAVPTPDGRTDFFEGLRLEASTSPFYQPSATERDLSVFHTRSAINFAYSWLADDLHRIGWVAPGLSFHN